MVFLPDYKHEVGLQKKVHLNLMKLLMLLKKSIKVKAK
jgi:hypothetical protein